MQNSCVHVYSVRGSSQTCPVQVNCLNTLWFLSYMFLSAMTQYHYGYLIDKCANMKLISYLLFVNQEKDMESRSRKQEKKDKRKGKKHPIDCKLDLFATHIRFTFFRVMVALITQINAY